MPEHHWACRHLNILKPLQGRVVSGHKEALQQVQRMAVAEGALKVAPLAVSGAFHTPLMQTAQDNLKQASQWLAHKFAGFLYCVCAAGAQSLQSMGTEKLAGCKEEALPNACVLQGLYTCLVRQLPCTTLARR